MSGFDKKKRLDKTLLWAEIANKDLHASRLLFENGYYNLSIFNLQQAIEKALKSAMLLNNTDSGKSDEQLFRAISHKPFCKILASLMEKGFSTGLQETFISECEKISKKKYNEMTDADYNHILNLISIINFQLEEDKLISTYQRKAYSLHRYELLLQAAAELYPDKPEVIEKARRDEKVKQELVNSMTEIAPVFLIIIFLSSILEQHESSTRYPDDTSSPLTIYNSEHTLIKNYWILYDASNSAIKLIIRQVVAYTNFVHLVNPDYR